MKPELLVFKLKHPKLVGHSSESMLQHGQFSQAFEELGLHSLIYHDSDCLYYQVHNCAGNVDGYRRLYGLRLDQVQPIASGQVGANVGDDGQFAVVADRNGEASLEVGDYGLVADVICDSAFAPTHRALANRPLEKYRLANFVTVDVLTFASNASRQRRFDVVKNRRAILALAAERADLLEKFPHFGTPGNKVNPGLESPPPGTGMSMSRN